MASGRRMRSPSVARQSILAAGQHAGVDLDLEIRAYRPADDLACRRIAAQAALSSYGARMPHLQHLFGDNRALEPADLRLVALARGRVAGFVELVGSHVANLFVDPAAQGRGIGARLLAEAEARIVGDVTLSVFTVNPDARRLYERLGYRVEEDGVASFGGSLEPVWRMRKTRGAPPFPLVVFDFDGTLADSAEWFIRSLNGVARRYGFREASAEEIEALRGAPRGRSCGDCVCPCGGCPRSHGICAGSCARMQPRSSCCQASRNCWRRSTRRASRSPS